MNFDSKRDNTCISIAPLLMKMSGILSPSVPHKMIYIQVGAYVCMSFIGGEGDSLDPTNQPFLFLPVGSLLYTYIKGPRICLETGEEVNEVPRPKDVSATDKWSKYCPISKDWRTLQRYELLDKHETGYNDYVSVHIKVKTKERVKGEERLWYDKELMFCYHSTDPT